MYDLNFLKFGLFYQLKYLPFLKILCIFVYQILIQNLKDNNNNNNT